MIASTSAGKFPDADEYRLQRSWTGIFEEDDTVELSRHDHVRVDAKPFEMVAMVQAVGNEAASRFGDEDRQAVDDRKGHEIDRAVGIEAITFYGV